MLEKLRVSMAQMTSHNTHKVNVDTLRSLAQSAFDNGADMLALPEAAGLMNKNKDHARQQITFEYEDPFIDACRHEAETRKLWIHCGSTPIKAPDGRYLNHTALIDPTGTIIARYDKIHLFDVFLDGRTPTGESNRYSAGTKAIVADGPFGPLGLSICYDLRFPHLYRDYALSGATILFIPSAFTVPTGRAHWEILLRARAIETGAYVIAPAQVGQHADGRVTWGHSMIISPWGDVLADLGPDAPGQVTLDLPLEAVSNARRQIPNLRNARDYSVTFIDETGNPTKSSTKTV